jgi:acyl-CoA reductase-like NAD-dependent aldehyde dehydrogenase
MPGGWTLDTLEKFLDSRIMAVEKNVTTAMAAADKAVTKAETAAEKRFDSVNEFRNAMKDQQSSFADKENTDMRLKTIEARMEQLAGIIRGVTIFASATLGLITAGAAAVTIEVLLRRG